jgi:ABC-type polysaccharide/polyol phosphate export permease
MFKGNFIKLYLVTLLEIRRNYGATLLSKAWFFGRPLLFVTAVFTVIYSGIRGQRIAEVSSLEFFELLGAPSIWYLFVETAVGSTNRISCPVYRVHFISPEQVGRS